MAEQDLHGKWLVLAANIEKGYAELDAAWARWSADHAVFETTDDKQLDDLKQQAKMWREHMDLRQKRAEQLAVAEQAAYDLKQIDRQPQTDATKAKHQNLFGKELEARSSALLAENVHPRAYWKFELGRLDAKNDPRTDWIKHIGVQVELSDAREETGTAGLAYGRALQGAGLSPTK